MNDPDVVAARERLMKYKGDYPAFCERTGLNYSWVGKFARGDRGKATSANQLKKLLTALDQDEQAEATDQTANRAG
jgi:hypothetical protein